MKLSQLKEILQNIDDIKIKLPNNEFIPNHFHITEIWQINKTYIDCGWTKRIENTVSMQIWIANDFDHRLTPSKLSKIIEISYDFVVDWEIEIEYQNETISKYWIAYDDQWFFLLTPMFTNCLAQDKCGIKPSELPKKSCCGWWCC